MHFGTGCLGQALVWIPKPVVTFELYNASEGLHFHQQESNFILMEDKGLAFEKEGGPSSPRRSKDIDGRRLSRRVPSAIVCPAPAPRFGVEPPIVGRLDDFSHGCVSFCGFC